MFIFGSYFEKSLLMSSFNCPENVDAEGCTIIPTDGEGCFHCIMKSRGLDVTFIEIKGN